MKLAANTRSSHNNIKIYAFILVLSICREEKYVALKVVKSAQHYTETATDEIRLLEVIRDTEPLHLYSDKIVKLLNHFTVRGVNGVHTCLVFEALGCSLYKLIVKNNYQGLAIPQVKSIIQQVKLQFATLFHTPFKTLTLICNEMF